MDPVKGKFPPQKLVVWKPSGLILIVPHKKCYVCQAAHIQKLQRIHLSYIPGDGWLKEGSFGDVLLRFLFDYFEPQLKNCLHHTI